MFKLAALYLTYNTLKLATQQHTIVAADAVRPSYCSHQDALQLLHVFYLRRSIVLLGFDRTLNVFTILLHDHFEGCIEIANPKGFSNFNASRKMIVQ